MKSQQTYERDRSEIVSINPDVLRVLGQRIVRIVEEGPLVSRKMSELELAKEGRRKTFPPPGSGRKLRKQAEYRAKKYS